MSGRGQPEKGGGKFKGAGSTSRNGVSQGGVVYGKKVLSEGGVVSEKRVSKGAGREQGGGVRARRLRLEKGRGLEGRGLNGRDQVLGLGSPRARRVKAGLGWDGEGGVGSRRASGFRQAPGSWELRGSRPR